MVIDPFCGLAFDAIQSPDPWPAEAALGALGERRRAGPGLGDRFVTCSLAVRPGRSAAHKWERWKNDGAEIYAEIGGTGVHMVGCTGDLKLTSGTKRFEGISGGGLVTIRSDFRKVTMVTADVIKEEGTGILFVQEFRYKLP